MSSHHDVIVIGAGPSGLASGARLAEMGLDTLVLDEQNKMGGQIYRNIEGAPPQSLHFLGEDYAQGLPLAERFRSSGASYASGAAVWQAEADGQVCYSKDGHSHHVSANYIVVATGAMERPMPIPGWNLPGVMGAGAANNLAKEAGLTPQGKVVIAGSGPLLLLEASLLLKKGVQVEAILETTPKLPNPAAIPRAPEALLRADFLWKGVKMLRDIQKSGVAHYKGVTQISAQGEGTLQKVQATCGTEKIEIAADILLLHFGVIPNTHIHRQIGCHMQWDKRLRYWYPQTDTWGRTNFERVFATGDGAYVSGALAAQYKGELAALEIAHCLGLIPDYERNQLAAPLRKAMRNDAFPRPFVDAMYAPRPEQFQFEDDTVLCRCENVTVGDVREAVRLGAHDLNEVKIVTRCGMGPCQGRMCGPALAEIVAAELETTPDKTGRLNIRPPLRNIPLAEIAGMDVRCGGSEPADLFKNQK